MSGADFCDEFVPISETLAEVFPGVFRWECYSSKHRVDLSSHAWLKEDVLSVVDPIGLRDDLREKLLCNAASVRIFLTSENHLRASETWLGFGAKVWARTSAGLSKRWINEIPDDQRDWFGFEIVDLPGGALGESALLDVERRMAFCGDALVNLPGRGLEVLPEKYCANQPALRRSLNDFAKRKIEWILPAHGQPIGPKAGELIAKLIGE
ncbi:MAG: hypothetical protein ISQ14_04085 [Verrucomicrobiae bacterium]|jgi:glyoxylase-like metal-dependent hydrolase (beta-lactamase superfamily II)|nr:hypothetical protein [Verrucomicrobiae bacterium]